MVYRRVLDIFSLILSSLQPYTPEWHNQKVISLSIPHFPYVRSSANKHDSIHHSGPFGPSSSPVLCRSLVPQPSNRPTVQPSNEETLLIPLFSCRVGLPNSSLDLIPQYADLLVYSVRYCSSVLGFPTKASHTRYLLECWRKRKYPR
jgi:hypothetical protein